MDRTGLLIALICAAGFGLLLGRWPELDLAIAAYFYVPALPHFPMLDAGWASTLRYWALYAIWAVALPCVVVLVLKAVAPQLRLPISRRAALFLLISLALAPGVLSNLLFKNHWGRPRPIDVIPFQGEFPFVAWWDPRGACPDNCSFFSGEASAAFWTYALAALAPPPWRPLAYLGATLFGLFTGALRMSFGGHFLSDVLAAGVITFVVVWLVHGYIYRWPRTRWNEAGVDAALGRLTARFRRTDRPV